MSPDVSSSSEFRVLDGRLVLYDVGCLEALSEALRGAFPGSSFWLEPPWEFEVCVGEDRGIPVWYWSDSVERFVRDAPGLLRSFVYPLVASGLRFVLAFPFPAAALRRGRLDLDSLERLDVEDIGALLTDDGVSSTLDGLAALDGRLVMTPIEELLAVALSRADVRAQPQVRFGRYRPDFLVESSGRRIAIEADGRQFHDRERDRQRDQALVALGIERVIRFTGSEIFRDADLCAGRVKQSILEGEPSTRGWQLEGLDESQLAAVNHGMGAARVLAPAGAGKTKTLVNRVFRLLEEGVDPSSILLLAFNKKAADQLIDRLVGAGVSTSPRGLNEPGVVCSTFHGFGYRYQRDILEYRPRLEQSKDVWSKLMRRALGDCDVQLGGAMRGSDPVGEFLRRLDRVRENLSSPDGEVVELERYGSPGEPEIVPLAPVYRAFEQRRLDMGIQSFGDLIGTTVRDLLASPERRRLVQTRFSHVLVDEFQDLNGAQLALIDILSRPWRNLFVVGDDDQLIYSWRFADLGNIHGFPERMPAEPYQATYTLRTNYRSSQAVVENSRRLIEHNRNRVKKEIQPRPGAPSGLVRVVRADGWKDRATAACEFLNAEKDRPGRRWRDLAVLCRYKAQQPLIAMALDQAGIPRSPLLRYRLFTDTSMRLLRSYLALARDPATLDGPSLAFLLNRPNRYFTNQAVNEISESTQPWELILHRASPDGGNGRFVPLIRQVEALNRRYVTGSAQPVSLLDDVTGEFALERFWRDTARTSGTRDQDDADAIRLLDVIRMFAADHNTIDAFLDDWDRRTQQELAATDSADDDLAREEDVERDQVVIGTIHSSKGREYDSIVLLDYHTDLARLTEPQVEEERRVYYVGLTRARDAILITLEGRRETLHPFLRETLQPPQPNEIESCLAQLESIHTRREEQVIARRTAQDEIEEILSGARLTAREEERTTLTRERETTDTTLNPLTEYLAAEGLTGALHKISPKRRRHEQAAHELQNQIDELDQQTAQLNREILLLRGDPTTAASPAQRRVDDAASSLLDLQREEQQTRGRLDELKLLS